MVPGQILAFGWGQKDTEHVTVRCKGSIFLEVACTKAHPADSPVVLVMQSPGGRLNVARVTDMAIELQNAGTGVQSGSRAKSPSATSDIAFEDPGDCKGLSGKRDMKLRCPSPTNHDDVVPWYAKFM